MGYRSCVLKWGFAMATCALLIGCASGDQPVQNVAATKSSATDIEIAPVSPAPPATSSAAKRVQTPPPDSPPRSLCDRYFTRMSVCMEVVLKDVPAESRSAALKALADAQEQTRAAFEKLDAATGDDACQTMLDALEQSCPKEAQ